MWTFQGTPECILCLSSAISVMALLSHNQMPRINQTHLTPFYLVTHKVGLRVEGSQFTLEGSPFQIISGTVNYFRIPRQYWRNTLRKMQACGFNTLTTYIPWNLHEPSIGHFHFTENLDLIAFVTMASEVGLWVILGPGPYIDNDLDLGGLPSWLLKDPKMKLRTTYKGFTKAVNQYFDQLIPRIAKFQYKNGGPIIAVQVENEYGSYHKDRKYMSYVKQALVSRGISELLMTADNGLDLKRGHLKNVLATVHMKNIQIETYKDLSSFQGSSPVLMMVYMADSSDTWGTARPRTDPHMLMKDVRDMFKLGFSLNFYMFQGGTNFGFIGGAHYSQSYLPVATTYDYSALLTEHGEYTPEYLVFQQFFHSVTEVPKSVQPESTQVIAYKSLKLLQFIPLWDILPFLDQPIKSVKPLSMEQLPVNHGQGQSYGFTLYETIISTGGLLASRGHVQDRGQVFLDNKYIGVLDHSKDQLSIVKNKTKEKHILRILVENQGRLSSGLDINKERKGLTGNIYLDGDPLRQFKIYSLEMKTALIQRKIPNFWKPVTEKVPGPAFFLSFLRVGDVPQDTFIKVQGWTKGVIFINGQNLGRYWNKGPQETLYLPGPWLHPGINEIMMFEESEGGLQIHFTAEAKLGHKFQIFGGSIHYFRVPRAYWKDRLLKLQACGFNTVTTYIPWNLHEQERGRFDFSENLDLEAYVRQAAKIGLWVILRPGPYICGEVDLGGLPSWLLRDPKPQLRTTDKGFVEAVDKYFDHLIPRTLPLQYHHGGPVIALQVENEYGSFNKDEDYMAYIKEALVQRGIVEMLFTADDKEGIVNGSVKGALATVNLGSYMKDSFTQLYQVQKNKPIMIMEYWTGWFDTWGSVHRVKSAKDYDAMLTEAGDYTKKYFRLRKLFTSVSAACLAQLPHLTPKAVYPSVKPSVYLPLFEILPYLNKPVMSHNVLTMENLPINNDSGQPFGLVLYETSICSGGHLHASAHDLAQVFLNDKNIGVLNMYLQYLHIPEFQLNNSRGQKCQLLRILVENQGRVNFSWKIQNEWKGLAGSVRINNVSLNDFTIYSLDMKLSFFKSLHFATWKPILEHCPGPAFYRGILRVGSPPKDTFLSLPNWKYGLVFINGRNLGRYHDSGPQKTLYLPGAWLHPEDNEIILFERMHSGSYIETTDKPML